MTARASLLLTSLLVLALTAIAGCGTPGRANVSPGPMPDGRTFTGIWNSPQYGTMTLEQSGSHVVGTYGRDERSGRIQGTVTGDLLRFEWTESRALVSGRPRTTRGRGYFRLIVGDDGDAYILGEWGHDDSETGGGEWRAAYDRRSERILRERASGSGGSDPAEDRAGTGDLFPGEEGSGSSGGGDDFPN